jgi:hypothetical protein
MMALEQEACRAAKIRRGAGRSPMHKRRSFADAQELRRLLAVKPPCVLYRLA